MVKGTSKRVVVVKSPDPRVFEQAIFIVREDFLKRGREERPGDILREAQAVADSYIKSAVPPRPRRLDAAPLVLFCAAGILLAVAVFLLVRYLV